MKTPSFPPAPSVRCASTRTCYLHQFTRLRCLAAVCSILAAAGGLQGQALISLPAGSSLIANPLSKGGDTLPEILSDVPGGTTFQKFNNFTQAYDPVDSFDAVSGWSDPTVTLHPGEGAFLTLPSPTVLTFTGTALSGSSTQFIFHDHGYQMLSSRSGKPDATVEDIFGGPPHFNFDVQTLANGTGVFSTHSYVNGVGWVLGDEVRLAQGQSALFFFNGFGAPIPEPAECGLLAGLGAAAFAMCRRALRGRSVNWRQ